MEFPLAWVAFVLSWAGAVACVLFAFKLWQATSARWWLLIGAAFLLSILSFIARCVMSGSLPLPHGMASPAVSHLRHRIPWFEPHRCQVVQAGILCAYWDCPVVGVWFDRANHRTGAPPNGGPAKRVVGLGHAGGAAIGELMR